MDSSGGELSIHGLGRDYRSTQCWEPLPGLTPRSHSGGGSTITTTCSTSKSDPRQANVTTTWALRGDKIYFDEAGQYQFVLSGQNCTASVRRTRVLAKVVRPSPVIPAGEPETATRSESPAVNADQPAPSAKARCAEPGPPRHLEVSPKAKLLLPTETFTFRSVVRDAHGCALGRAPAWTVTSGSELGELLAPGKVRIRDEAKGGRLTLRATLAGQSVEVGARIVTREEYERLLASGDYAPSGESRDSATTTIAGATLDATARVVQEESPRRWAVLALAAAGVLLLGGIMVFIARRRTPRATAPASVPHESEERNEPSSAATRVTRKVCPVCGKQYPVEAEFCGTDGAHLMPMN